MFSPSQKGHQQNCQVLKHTQPLCLYDTLQLTIHSQRDTWVWPNGFLGGNPCNAEKSPRWKPNLLYSLGVVFFCCLEKKRKNTKNLKVDEQKNTSTIIPLYIASIEMNVYKCKNTTFHLAWPSLTIVCNAHIFLMKHPKGGWWLSTIGMWKKTSQFWNL